MFVLIGPLYAAADGHEVSWVATLGAFLAFAFASSACYVINDLRDAESDRAHPRKCRRPIASGAIRPGPALGYAAFLALVAAGCTVLAGSSAPLLLMAVGIYVANVNVYSLWLKHVVILDVISLAMGFVLRVLGGCAAVGVEPSTWLLNCTFFLSMFLAFGKRLGERRTLGDAVGEARAVQRVYTDDMLRMLVVVTAVGSLLTYSGYIQTRESMFTVGFNLLWLTMLPATYGLVRCIVLLEQGRYDDPTELAIRDLAFQVSAGIFGVITVALVAFTRLG